MILKNVNKVIYLNAGHSSTDPGAVGNSFTESNENRLVRDLCIPLLKEAGFEVKLIPDALNLRKSIDWINLYAKDINDGLVVPIHFNFASDPEVKGTEVYYYGEDPISKDIAKTISTKISEFAGTVNRGPKSDTTTRFGELGIIRQTNCWVTLIEVEFLSNLKAMEALDYVKVAKGIVAGIKEVYGMDPGDPPNEQPRNKAPQQTTLTGMKLFLDKLMARLRKLLEILNGRGLQPT